MERRGALITGGAKGVGRAVGLALAGRMVKNIPAGHVGSNADAVSAALFLLSDEARYVNGTNVHVSGAWGI